MLKYRMKPLLVVGLLSLFIVKPIFAGPAWSQQFWPFVYQQGWVVPTADEFTSGQCSLRKITENEKEALKSRFCNVNDKPEPMSVSDYLSDCINTLNQMVGGIKSCDTLNLVVKKAPDGTLQAYKQSNTKAPSISVSSSNPDKISTTLTQRQGIVETIKYYILGIFRKFFKQ